jgi:uncharacterized protein DUF6174
MRISVKVPLLALLLVGCDSPFENERDELRERQAAWQRLGINDYSFVLSYSCGECPPEIGPWRISVRADEKVSVVRIRDGLTLPNTTGETIEDIFARLERHSNEKNAILKVGYDPRYHFPADVFTDTRGYVDGASGSYVTEFQLLRD